MSTDEPLPPTPERASDDVREDPRPRVRPDPLLGKALHGRYRLVSLLAKGGMGRVYRAEQAPLGRMVAVKVLDVGQEHDDDQEFRRRFVREAETCARLTHPNTVRVFEYGQTDDDVLYIAMELLVGRNLFQAIQTDAPMDALRVARIGQQIAASLREAHGLGLIHRDLKPSNIILTRPDDDEFVKVVDFGLVKEIRADAEMTRQDTLVGSPSYMSPEQVRSDPLDQRSDVYSLGVLLYACLCGRPPFHGSSSLNVLMGHLNEAPPPMASVCPSMPRAPALEAVVLRCLAKAPADRYPDMGALLRALQAAEGELTGVRAPAGEMGTGPVTGPVTDPAAPAVAPAVAPDARPAPPQADARMLLGGLVALVLAGAGVAAWGPRGASEPAGDAVRTAAAVVSEERGSEREGEREGDALREPLLPEPPVESVVESVVPPASLPADEPVLGASASAVPAPQPPTQPPTLGASTKPMSPETASPEATKAEPAPAEPPPAKVARRPRATPPPAPAPTPAPTPTVEGLREIRDPWTEP